MFKIFNMFKAAKIISTAQSKSICDDPKMPIKKWYELQHKLREEQMAQARAIKED